MMGFAKGSSHPTRLILPVGQISVYPPLQKYFASPVGDVSGLNIKPGDDDLIWHGGRCYPTNPD
jgi:hypothetical protein